jgi:predicted transposase YdaD
MKHRKSDILWKVIIEKVFADLLRFIYKDADQVYDMDRGFEYLDKELAELDPQPDEEKDSRFADKLVRVYHRDGLEEWVLLHIEVQGDTSDRDAFAERMWVYFYRIRDRYPGRLLSSLAIFTGEDADSMPAHYSYEYRGTQLTYKYPTLSIRAFSDEELENSSNPFAQVILAARIRLLEGQVTEDDLLMIKLIAARKLFAKGFDTVKVGAIFTFLRNYVLFEKPEINRRFDDEIREINKEIIMDTVDIIKMEAKEEVVEQLLQDTTLNLSVEKIAALTNVPVKVVKEIKEELGIR